MGNIIEICDVICLTEKIMGEYQKPGYNFSSLLPELEKLKSRQPPKIAEPNLGRKQEIKGIPKSHRAFIEDGVRLEAGYFITEENPRWLEQSKNIEKQHGLRIVTPEQYINKRKKVRQ